MNMSRRRVPLVVLATVALACAGCSSEPAGKGPAGNANDARAQGVRFAQCMRDHGVREFPDPDASGELTIDGIVNGSSLDPSAPAWKQAIGACKDLQPAGFTGHRRSAAEQTSALEFARCIRDHGVEDFPDPTADGPLVDTRRIPSTDRNGGMSILNAAMQTCGATYARRLGLKGR